MKKGVYFQCQRCGNCCRWSGEVPIGDEELETISAFLGLSPFDFIAQFATLRRNRAGLALIEKSDGACIFLKDGNHCVIQEVKPKQCRGFPNTWNFPGWREVCEAIPVEINANVEMGQDEEPSAIRISSLVISPSPTPVANRGESWAGPLSAPGSSDR